MFNLSMNRVNRPILRKAFRYFIFFFIGTALVTAGFILNEIRAEQKLIKNLERNEVLLIRLKIGQVFQIVLSDIHFLINTPFVKNGSATHNYTYTKDLEKHFKIFIESNPDLYDQVRFIDTKGMEIVRINNDSPAKIVPRKELQNKSKRYYFKDSIKLNPEKVYISPLDLNIEHGRIEIPHKPVIRIAAPVFESNGKKTGIIVLNFLAKNILDEIQMLHIHHNKEEAHYRHILFLLNREGSWLNPPPTYDDRHYKVSKEEPSSFMNSYPEIWETVRKNESGLTSSHAGLFAFTTIRPKQQNLVSSKVNMDTRRPPENLIGSDQYFWKLVSLTTASSIRSVYWNITQKYIVIDAMLILLFWFISLNIARKEAAREEAFQQLRLSLEEQKKSNDIKNRFFSIIGHDLRGPLGSVYSLLQLLEEDLDSGAAGSEKVPYPNERDKPQYL